jgi:two-component system, sensor histidine kinase
VNSLPRLTVLVLDDDPVARDAMSRYLRLYGYESIETETVEQAVAAFARETIDAVILDVRLPGPHSGLDALQALRQRPELAAVPVLIVTGAVLSEAEEAAIVRQRAFLFHKPEGLDALVSFLDQLTLRDRPH